MLIGKLSMGARERLMVTILDKPKGTRFIDCRVYRILQDGQLMPTDEGIAISPDQVEALAELLREAVKKKEG